MVKPGYKQTEVGEIPEDWDVKTLAMLCPANGLVRGPFGGALKKESFVKSGYAVYEQRHAIASSVDVSRYFIDKDKYTELSRFQINAGDLIVSCSGTIGRIFKIPKNYPEGIINQALLKITLKDNVNLDYFVLLFKSPYIQDRIVDSSHGGAMPNLVGMEDFKKTLFQLPPPEEQKEIAKALSDVDELIVSLEKLIAKKRDIKTATMQQLLTGKKRLPGFGGEWNLIRIENDASLKARIGWQALTTKEYLDSGTYYLVTGTDFVGGRVNWSTCHFVDEWRYVQDRNIQLKEGDVLLTKDGTIGKVGYVDHLELPATLNSGVFVIRPINNKFDPLFLYYILSSRVFDEFLAKITAGSTITHLYQKDFVNFEFLAPDIAEQKEIALALDAMDIELAYQTKELNKTKAIKQGMMQELLTGRTRLVDVVAPIQEQQRLHGT